MIIPNSHGTRAGYMRKQPVEFRFQGRTTQVVGGFLVPLALLVYCIYSWATGEALIIGTTVGLYRVIGSQAIAAGVCGFGIAVACHFHFFWRTTPFLWRFALVGELAGAITWLVSLGYLIWAMAMEPW